MTRLIGIVSLLFIASTVPMGLVSKPETQTVSVRVHDVTGSPISSAKARLLSLDRVLQAGPNADRVLQFDSVLPGTYDLEVSARGFSKRIYRDLRIPGSDSEALDVVLNVASQPDHCGFLNTLDYKAITPGARMLSGRVIYEDSGKGLSGVSIELINPSVDRKVASAVSGPDGNFAFPDLPAGRYSVLASKNAYVPAELNQFLVPRENLTVLTLGLDKQGHMHVCQ